MASPGPFPPEIIQRIVYYLTHGWIGADGPIGDNHTPTGTFRNWGRIGGCARYAIVDRTWQYAVEHETFAELQLDLARLAEAEAILNSVPRRQRCVRAIVLHVVLPPRPDTAPRRTETTDERRRNNHALQETFEAFVSALGRWTRPGPPVRLSLEAFAMTRGSGREAWVPDTMTHCSPLELEDPERVLRLGPVNAVTELDMKRNDLVGRPFSGAAVGALLATMPAAKEVSIGYLATKSHFRMRSAFARALANVTHDINRFHVAGIYAEPDYLHPSRQLRDDKVRPDELSQTLGVLSQRVRDLDLYEVVVSDDLFLQHSPAPGMALPAHWARLENFSLYYPPVTPLGEWLFYPDPSARGGLAVADPTLQRRYLAAARAALEMPLLQNMTLVAQLEGMEGWHKFWYHRDAENRVSNSIWTSSTGFVPEDQVLAAWREVSSRHWGETELKVEILDDEYAV